MRGSDDKRLRQQRPNTPDSEKLPRKPGLIRNAPCWSSASTSAVTKKRIETERYSTRSHESRGWVTEFPWLSGFNPLGGTNCVLRFYSRWGNDGKQMLR